MNEADAMKILSRAAAAPKRMEAFDALAKQLGVPRATVYHWWWKKKARGERGIPPWRLAAFDKLLPKKRRAA